IAPSSQDLEPPANSGWFSGPVVITIKDKDGRAQEKFYVRSGNSSQEMSMAEMQAYLNERFGR
ncbi:MAG: hypothetical protein ACOYJ6_17185, partial [Caulobacterales bacterium]